MTSEDNKVVKKKVVKKDELAEPANTSLAGDDQGNDSNKVEVAQPDKSQGSVKAKSENKQSGQHSTGGGNGSKGTKAWLLIVALLLLAVLGAGGYWLGDRGLNKILGFDQQLAEQQAMTSDLYKELEKRLERERELRQQHAAKLDNQMAQMANSVLAQENRVRELGGSSRKDWLLAEAEFLVRLANQRLIIERDSANARALLVTADDILRDLDDVELVSVRKLLARDITALGLMSTIDTEGLYFRLSAIADSAEALPMIPVLTVEGQVDSAHESEQAEAWWIKLGDNFASALSHLGELVRIQYHQQPVKPLLSEAQEQQVRMTLSLVLEQAQVALLRNQNAVYQNALKKARQLLTDYYQLERGAGSLVQQLEGLAVQPITVEQPDISTGLKSLKEYIEVRHAVKRPGANS